MIRITETDLDKLYDAIDSMAWTILSHERPHAHSFSDEDKLSLIHEYGIKAEIEKDY